MVFVLRVRVAVLLLVCSRGFVSCCGCLFAGLWWWLLFYLVFAVGGVVLRFCLYPALRFLLYGLRLFAGVFAFWCCGLDGVVAGVVCVVVVGYLYRRFGVLFRLFVIDRYRG